MTNSSAGITDSGADEIRLRAVSDREGLVVPEANGESRNRRTACQAAGAVTGRKE